MVFCIAFKLIAQNVFKKYLDFFLNFNFSVHNKSFFKLFKVENFYVKLFFAFSSVFNIFIAQIVFKCHFFAFSSVFVQHFYFFPDEFFRGRQR
jgi:hypothetical protein